MAIPKSVFPHQVVGNTAAYSPSDWQNDINLAKAVGIDAFALNIAAQTNYNEVQLDNAYRAAESLGFKLFLSFDYAAQGAWSSSAVIALLQKYAGSAAQFKVNGASFVSTFEGPANSEEWRTIRASVPIFLVPDWTSVGPDRFRNEKLDVVDGACRSPPPLLSYFLPDAPLQSWELTICSRLTVSWDAWPQGAVGKTDDSDKAWKAAAGSKTYMMPVSPWFYANLPDKNYLWRGDDLWHQRWQQVLEIQPNFVEIITWNDYGESHYIGPITAASGIPDGAHKYIDNMPHDHWRDLLPYYIEAYKSGGSPAVTADTVQVWYRLSPAAAGSNGGTVGNAPWEPPADANSVVQDTVFFTALVREPSTVSVQIGSNQADTFQASSSGLFHASTPFNGRTGEVTVTITRNGQAVIAAIRGAAIVASPPNGLTNYNAWPTPENPTGRDLLHQQILLHTVPKNFKQPPDFFPSCTFKVASTFWDDLLELITPYLRSAYTHLPSPLQAALGAFSSHLDRSLPHQLTAFLSTNTTTQVLLTILLPLFLLLFSMSSWGRFWPSGGRYSPFAATSNQPPPTVTEADYHYLGPDDIDPPSSVQHHTDSYGFPPPRITRNDSTTPDILVLKHRTTTYPLHFPAYAIADGAVTVGEVRRLAARETKTDDHHRIKLLYKGKILREDPRSCRDEGLKQNSEILCVVSEAASSSSFPSSSHQQSTSSSASEDEMLDNGIGGPRIDVDGTLRDDRPSRTRRKGHRGGRSKKKASTTSSTPKDSSTYLSAPEMPYTATSSTSPNRAPSPARPTPSPAPPPQSSTPAPVPPPATNKPLTPRETLDALASRFHTEFVPRCVAFTTSPPQDAKTREMEYKVLSETILAQIILKLDAVETEGDEGLRAKRKELVRETQKVLGGLDGVVKGVGGGGGGWDVK
ncbi:MAG: hypothetical protein Q9219_005019 [cf. Caloplaca sp. 3 TL-2023]